MSIIVTHKGITRIIKDEEQIKGIKCRQCRRNIDALSFALGTTLCFKCLKKIRRRER